MSQIDSINKAREYIQEAFAECYEYTEVASLFHLIVQEAKTQVNFMCRKIAEEHREADNEQRETDD